MGFSFFLVGLGQDEFQHRDGTVSTLALPFVLFPCLWRCWILLNERLVELIIVSLQHCNGICEELLCSHKIFDVLLVSHVTFLTVRCFSFLGFVVFQEGLLSGRNLIFETCFWRVDCFVEPVNLAFQLQNLLLFLRKLFLVGFPLFRAPHQVLLILSTFLVDKLDHLVDLIENSVEWVLCMKQRHHVIEPWGFVALLCGSPAEQPLHDNTHIFVRNVPLHRRKLNECRFPC
mmetsp:Transcript_1834/g.3199  ORF Transcript_1834/g.3199 Transcript_1834/m.3199 type:complete len:231 (-) Transcript_1834:1132-1824(-)